MKRTFVKLFLASVFLLTGFTSCERDADVDLPNVPSKLALSCFISPQDTIIRAYVSRSIPIFTLNTSGASTNEPFGGATVTLTGNSGSVQLVYNAATMMYEIPASQFQIVPGGTYSISVSANQYQTLTAQTTVPNAAPSDFAVNASIAVDSITFPGFPIISADLDHQFTDVAGTVNYYQITVVMETYDSISARSQFLQLIQALDNDNNKDGQLIRGNLSTGTNIFGNAVGLHVYLTTSGFDFYEFHRTILNGQNSGDPFAEPALVHSNVTNGYGIFSGVNITSVFIPL
ncbi:MAG: DUF4249 domain-containing protein [Bacteroidota bacterium]